MDNSKKKILIVDDQKLNTMILAKILKPEYDVLVALNGSDGLEIAESQLPDLILLDVLMPDTDGYEVLEKLKASDNTKNIPVIFISGLDSNEDEEKGLSLGAAGYVAKPFDEDTVISSVEKHLP